MCTAPDSEATSSARRITAGWRFHVAVTSDPMRAVDDLRLGAGAGRPGGGGGGEHLGGPRASGWTRIASVRPAAWPEQLCCAEGRPR